MRNRKAVAAVLALVVALVMLAGPALASAAPMGKTFGALSGGQLSFEKLDANGDGLVTQAELDDLAGKKFAALDANGDGSLTQNEVSEAAEQRAVARARKRSAKVFKRLDSDGDGLLSFDKFKTTLDNRSDSGKGMIGRLDTNGDGAVSEAEFDAGKQRRQAKLRKKAGSKVKGLLKKPSAGRFGF